MAYLYKEHPNPYNYIKNNYFPSSDKEKENEYINYRPLNKHFEFPNNRYINKKFEVYQYYPEYNNNLYYNSNNDKIISKRQLSDDKNNKYYSFANKNIKNNNNEKFSSLTPKNIFKNSEKLNDKSKEKPNTSNNFIYNDNIKSKYKKIKIKTVNINNFDTKYNYNNFLPTFNNNINNKLNNFLSISPTNYSYNVTEPISSNYKNNINNTNFIDYQATNYNTINSSTKNNKSCKNMNFHKENYISKKYTLNSKKDKSSNYKYLSHNSSNKNIYFNNIIFFSNSKNINKEKKNYLKNNLNKRNLFKEKINSKINCTHIKPQNKFQNFKESNGRNKGKRKINNLFKIISYKKIIPNLDKKNEIKLFITKLNKKKLKNSNEIRKANKSEDLKNNNIINFSNNCSLYQIKKNYNKSNYTTKYNTDRNSRVQIKEAKTNNLSSNKYIESRNRNNFPKNILTTNGSKIISYINIRNNTEILKKNKINIIKEKKNESGLLVVRRRKYVDRNLLVNAKKIECQLCHKFIVSHLFKIHYNSHPSKILNWLYLGSFSNACNIEELRRNKINYILNCALECYNKKLPDDIKELHLKLLDQSNFEIIEYFEKANNFIRKCRKEGGKLLVHCKYGISRSASFIIAYLVKYNKITVDNALKFLQQKRSQVKPNKGFMDQLYLYEQYLKKRRDSTR